MKIFIINGANLNMLGIREPEIYGRVSYSDLCAKVEVYAECRGIETVILQSNCEGELVDFVQRAYFEHADGIVINPGAYTHTSIALLDALLAAGLPSVEVHLSDPDRREDFRRVSYIRSACIGTVKGMGPDGYLRALDLISEKIKG